jgi:hypothetical protein
VTDKHNRRNFFSRMLAAITGAVGLLSAKKALAKPFPLIFAGHGAKAFPIIYGTPKEVLVAEIPAIITSCGDNGGGVNFCDADGIVLPGDRLQVYVRCTREIVVQVWRKPTLVTILRGSHAGERHWLVSYPGHAQDLQEWESSDYDTGFADYCAEQSERLHKMFPGMPKAKFPGPFKQS